MTSLPTKTPPLLTFPRHGVVLVLAFWLAPFQLVAAAPNDQAQETTRAAVVNGPDAPKPPDVSAPYDAGRPMVRAIRLTELLRLDGTLDERVYQTAPSASEFVQQVPKDGMAATEKTDVWVMFDAENLYIAARCWDSAPPEKWVADEYRRDTVQLKQNDGFGVALDTFYDRRNGFAFYTNPFGARADYAITDEVADFNWNPVWDVRPGRFDGGWTVEMQVPFKSLRYKSGSEQVWGVQFRRIVRRKNEWAYLTRVPSSVAGPIGLTKVSFGGNLTGLDLPAANTNVELKPYATSRSTTDLTKTPAIWNKGATDIGVDAKYGVTASLTADFTYNTDFADVEVDQQQVNLTRFSLLFPEKREFFLEGGGLFDFGRATSGLLQRPVATAPILFFTRRIGVESGGVVPVDFGARLTGKVDRWSIGALNIQTGDSPTVNVPATNFTALRVKRNVLRRSSIGAIFTNRSHSSASPGSNQVYGVDTGLSFAQDFNFSGYLARTRTPGLTGNDTSYQAELAYVPDRYGFQFAHLFVGDDFNPEVGFLQRSDFRSTFVAARFSPRPRSIQSVRKFTFQGNLNYISNGAGALETRQEQAQFITELENSDQLTLEATRNYELLVRPFAIARNVTIPVGAYPFSGSLVSYMLGAQRRLSGTVSMERGNFYSGTITALGFATGRFAVTPRFSLEPSARVNRVVLPQGRFTTKLFLNRADYAFTTRMFVSTLLQYNSANRQFSTNLRFRWEYRPGSEFFFVYTDERDTTGAGFPSLRNRAVVLKINRLFRF